MLDSGAEDVEEKRSLSLFCYFDISHDTVNCDDRKIVHSE